MSTHGYVPEPLTSWRACALYARALLDQLRLGGNELEAHRALSWAIDTLLRSEAVAPALTAAAPAMASPWSAAAPPAMVPPVAMAPAAAMAPAPAMAPTPAMAVPGAGASAVAPAPAPGPTTLTVVTYGENEKGALGQGFQRPPNWEGAREVALPAGAELAAVAAGNACTALLFRDGSLLLAGSNSSYLHADTQSRGRDVPTAVPLLAGRRVSRMFLTGSSTHMFACIDGRLHGWGRLSVALGLDRRSITTEPTPVERLGRMHHPGGIPEELIYDVAVGAGHSLVLATSGEVFAGGSNSRGQLGMGSQNNPFELFTLERSEDTSGIRFTAGGC